jgi:hypothetical protein
VTSIEGEAKKDEKQTRTRNSVRHRAGVWYECRARKDPRQESKCELVNHDNRIHEVRDEQASSLASQASQKESDEEQHQAEQQRQHTKIVFYHRSANRAACKVDKNL